MDEPQEQLEMTEESLQFTIDFQVIMDYISNGVSDYITDDNFDTFVKKMENLWCELDAKKKSYAFFFALAQWVIYAELFLGKRTLDDVEE